MEDKVIKELKRMTNIGVITPVEEAITWVLSMVATRKKNTEEIRLCIDSRDLNGALKRPHHPMKIVEEITRNLANATVFTVLDANFFFGRDGINSGSEVFQRTMEILFEGCPCEIIVDGLLVTGKDLNEQDNNLKEVLQRIQKVGLCLNKNKCKFRQSQVSYVGHLLTDNGIKPDPEKINAIWEMPVPKDTQALSRFLDHQPLITIVKKPLHKAPARLQKLLMQLQRYHFELLYKKGAELYLADTLSRAPTTDTGDDDFLYEVMEVSHISDAKQEELRIATKEDRTLLMLINTIFKGWPKTPKSCPSEIRSYFTFRDELSVDNGIVMKGHKSIIPRSLQSSYTQILHKGHPGIEATKRRAREIVYWRSMCDELKQVCDILPDIFEWNNKHFLVLVDSYSGWFEVNTLTDLTSATVIVKLKRHFATHGTPRILISDNGGQYSGQQFKQFASEWNFVHITSSPEHAQSNGLVVNAVIKAGKDVVRKDTKRWIRYLSKSSELTQCAKR
ncbi:uncharacterized protein K02A2.6-like [Anneissia japonica]|uniref:uncharacterized protein K02A2.6-like n=1 Tax=Anneissia japonica TaxID=1529436 RepID=UPI00142577E6|nr:uncharacterized protein K02A2.6-like [Anneissia japonica]